MIFIMAWRNIWRQKRRTLLTLSTIAIGLGSVIFFDNMGLGFRDRFVEAATRTMIGHGLLHAPNYHKTGDPEYIMAGRAALLDKVQKHPEITHATARIYGPVLSAMGDRSASLQFLGTNFEAEKSMTNWRERLSQEGTFPQNTRQVIIGAKLAEKLEVKQGGKLVITAADFYSGELNSFLVRISAIIHSEDGNLNEHMMLGTLELGEELFGVKDAAHEIAVRTSADPEDRDAIEAILTNFKSDTVQPQSWQELMAGLLNGMELQNLYMLITFAIMCLLAGLGIANSMGMSLLERIREFGMLQAIGTDHRHLGTMVVLEYTLMGMLGGLLGFALGMAISYYLSLYGIPINDVEIGGMVFQDPIFPRVQIAKSLNYALIFMAFVPLLAIIPIRKILKRDPAQSIRFQG